MTTVAWDGKTLAADSRCTSSGLAYNVTKVWRLSDGRLFGATGTMSYASAVKDWLNGEGPKPEGVKEFTGIRIRWGADSPVIELCDENLCFYAIEPELKQFALGSGRDYALAAMALGKSAAEAVELAARFDVYTGLPVVTLSFGHKISRTALPIAPAYQTDHIKWKA